MKRTKLRFSAVVIFAAMLIAGGASMVLASDSCKESKPENGICPQGARGRNCAPGYKCTAVNVDEAPDSQTPPGCECQAQAPIPDSPDV